MKLRCAIVDDEPLAIEVMEGFLKKIPNIEVVSTFNNAISVIDFIKNNRVDFLFLDIEMPNLSGIELLKSLQNPPLVIITSANKNYAIEGYELSVVDYLLKPLTFERVIKAINKLSDIIVSTTHDHDKIPDYIFLKENKRMVKVNLDDILFVESMKDYVKVVTRDKTVVTKQNLSDFEKILNPKDFVRVHKSFIIPLSKVDAFSTTMIEIGLFEVPIGRSYKDEALKHLGEISDT
ncbi:MAG: DNA-binding response regulator [Bacteroidetes bacterium HGW-Bacteroidetes-15]|nr:MAG: DNA-binding response regulator [Bacteroidetes bacterium HGW-Bacteroidetes-15]